MNKKGFTLVELLAIIILLLGICAISYPSLTNYLKNNKETEMDTYKENLCLAAKTYINANKSIYTNMGNVGEIIEVPISELISYGNVENDLVEPETQEKASKHKLIIKVLEDKTLECTYQ